MGMFFNRCIAVITSIFTLIGLVLFPANPAEPVFEESEKIVKTAFDEGEFVMGEYDLIVSPSGDDSNPGTPEKPLRTFAAAKEKLRYLDAESDEAVTVWFREGTYFIDNIVEFNESDRQNVVYRSYPDEDVAFSGSEPISEWSETTVNGVKAFAADVEINSDNDYFRALFKDGKPLSRSNYPKSGMFKIVDPLTDEATLPEYEPSFFTHSMAFCVNPDEVKDFANVGDVDIRIMHFWCDDILPLHSVDAKTGRVETTKPSSMTVRVDDNFIFENVKEALSLPGEWYLDRSEEKLYYIPQEGDTVDNTVVYAGKNEKLMSFSNAKNISFEGISFENTGWNHFGGSHFAGEFDQSNPLYQNLKYGSVHPQAAFETPAAINISASSGINFTNCRFENISTTAVKFEKASQNCDITSSLFNEIGANAIFIHGDFVVPATTKNINVKDCHISRYGRIFNNAIGILLTHAIDCELSNNEVHDGWYTGISVGWNWGYSDNPTNNIKIKDNLIYNIGNGWLSDMGAIYTLGIQPETVISGNVIYNVGCYGGEYGYGGWGIYLDEGSSGMLVENNLVYDCSSETFHQHYGRDNIIRNNIFAFGGEGAFLITRKEDHNSLTAENNIFVVDDALVYTFNPESKQFVDNSNLMWDYSRGGNVYSGYSTGLFDRLSLVLMVAKGYYNNAVYADPLFRDAAQRDFTLATNSPAIEAGFKPFAYNAGTKTLFE